MPYSCQKRLRKRLQKKSYASKSNPRVTYRELAEALAMTEDGIYWSVKQLRKQGILHRIGSLKRAIGK